jgi:hypothetical protein
MDKKFLDEKLNRAKQGLVFEVNTGCPEENGQVMQSGEAVQNPSRRTGRGIQAWRRDISL